MNQATLQPAVPPVQALTVAQPTEPHLPPAGGDVAISENKAPTSGEEANKLTEREIAYTINDKYFKGFEVLKSANAWWMERGKVEDLIRCFKNGYNIKQSCIMAGISIDQYKYFVSIHPLFSSVREACEEIEKMMVESNIHEFLIDKDKETTRWFAERRIPEKYGRNLAMGEGGAPVINNFGTIINAPAQNVPASVAARIKANENAGSIPEQ